MFPYDPALAALVQTPPASIAGVLELIEKIDTTCIPGDGLRWFNSLYAEVTQAIETRVAGAGFSDPTWISELDAQFAKLYFNALYAGLTGAPCPGSWQALFACRADTRIARIQFALAGVNAHINHDLPEALVATCGATATPPLHVSIQYRDYTAVNMTLDGIIETAKKALYVRLLGDPLPVVSHLEDTIAAWSMSAARESAWNNAEILWHLQSTPVLASSFLDNLDGLTTVAGKALLVPVP
jgi:hypothetical protein